jgi:hypothetical protein
MTFEAQIVLRRDNPKQLADDVRAVAEFIERRSVANAQGEANERHKPRSATRLALVHGR